MFAVVFLIDRRGTLRFVGLSTKEIEHKISFASGKDVVNLTAQVQFAMLVYDDF